MASISISNEVRLAIVNQLTDYCHEHDVETTSDVTLAEIEEEIMHLLLDYGWVDPEDAADAAEGLAPQFDDLACERY